MCVIRAEFSVSLWLRGDGMAGREGTWWRGIVDGGGIIGISGAEESSVWNARYECGDWRRGVGFHGVTGGEWHWR